MEAYSTTDALLAPVIKGDLQPLSGRYLIRLAQGQDRLERRQDLPVEAFYAPDESALSRVDPDYHKNFFIALSYRWLQQGHPDPAKFHLYIIAKFLEKHFSYWASHGIEDAAVFWDFGSLYQKMRTELQEESFQAGLKASNRWYGSTQSQVWLQSRLPPGFGGASYDRSGWCFVEAAISSAVKESFDRWDLAKGTKIDAAGNVALLREGYVDLGGLCRSDRLAPLLPSKVEHLLTTEKVFTNDADVSVVTKIYKTFFDNVSSSVQELDFGLLGWSASQLGDLADALPCFTSLKKLNLSYNDFGDAGAAALASGLQANSSLQHLDIRDNKVSDEGAIALAQALKANSSLTNLYMNGNKISDEGAGAFAQALQAIKSLKTLHLTRNQISDEGAGAFAQALQENQTLKTLVLRQNKIGTKGKAALEEAKQARDDIGKPVSIWGIEMSDQE